MIRPYIIKLVRQMYEARCKPGGTQIFWGYGCPSGNFDNHPVVKLQKNQICNPYSNKIFCFTLQSINFRTNLSIFFPTIFKLKAPDILTTFFEKKKVGAIANH